MRDELTGEEFTVRARAVVNATGVWAGTLDPGVRLRPSRGTHLVLRPDALPGLRAGLHVPIPGESNRFALVLPQPDGRVYVGLTDVTVDGPVPDVPQAPEEDIRTLLDVLNTVLETELPRTAVAGAYAGLRPLLAAPTGAPRTSRAGTPSWRVTGSSRWWAASSPPTGGWPRTPWTGRSRCAACARARAVPPRSRRGSRARGRRRAPRLVRRYGAEAPAVQRLVTAHPEPVGLGLTLGDLIWSVRHEGALDADDLLDRRTRIGLVAEDRERAALGRTWCIPLKLASFPLG